MRIEGDSQRYVVCADEKLSAFLELESAIHDGEVWQIIAKNLSSAKVQSCLKTDEFGSKCVASHAGAKNSDFHNFPFYLSLKSWHNAFASCTVSAHG
jgi:hypothetical protein